MLSCEPADPNHSAGSLDGDPGLGLVEPERELERVLSELASFQTATA
ncbi:MAG TPA: hypothetical protein VGL51_04655 [Solirubrobacteraceae bacterium]|jgi:hypothetical protein